MTTTAAKTTKAAKTTALPVPPKAATNNVTISNHKRYKNDVPVVSQPSVVTGNKDVWESPMAIPKQPQHKSSFPDGESNSHSHNNNIQGNHIQSTNKENTKTTAPSSNIAAAAGSTIFHRLEKDWKQLLSETFPDDVDELIEYNAKQFLQWLGPDRTSRSLFEKRLVLDKMKRELVGAVENEDEDDDDEEEVDESAVHDKVSVNDVDEEAEEEDDDDDDNEETDDNDDDDDESDDPWPYDFDDRAQKKIDDGSFAECYRMSAQAFYQLLEWIRPAIEEDESESLSPEWQLHCTLRFLAGGSEDDIRIITGYSESRFISVIRRVMRAIDQLTELQLKRPSTPNELRNASEGFANLSTQRVFTSCVAALGGWFCKLDKPLSLNALDYYCDHCHFPGANVQVMCDSKCRFLYIGAIVPGSFPDWYAYTSLDLNEWVDKIPGNYFVTADNAYRCSNKLIVPFSGSQCRDDGNNTFNFYLSQLQTTVKQALGLLFGKWQLFLGSLRAELVHFPTLLRVCAKLHNYCIDQGIDVESSHSQICRWFHAPLGYVPSAKSHEKQPSAQSAAARFRSSLRDRVVEMKLPQPERTRKRKTT
jgi:hypothetical protein